MKMKRAIITTGVFVSAMIGAGFASGSEILFYFAKYKREGFFGIIISVLLFSLLEYCILTQAGKRKAYLLEDYISSVSNKYFSKITTATAYFFMLIIFSAMLSGFGEMGNELFGISKKYCSLLLLFCCNFILTKGYKGFETVESVLSVIIVLFLFATGIYLVFFRELTVSAVSIADNAAVSAFGYSGYNILTNTAVLCILARENNKKSALCSSILSGIILLVLMTLFWYILCTYAGKIPLGAIPVLTLCRRHSGVLTVIYTLALIASMLTTAVSSAYSLAVGISPKAGKRTARYMITVIGYFLSAFEFSVLVDKFYRVVGIFSVAFMAIIFYYQIKDLISERKT